MEMQLNVSSVHYWEIWIRDFEVGRPLLPIRIEVGMFWDLKGVIHTEYLEK